MFKACLLQIYCRVCSEKHLKNRLIFGEVLGKSLMSSFLTEIDKHFIVAWLTTSFLPAPWVRKWLRHSRGIHHCLMMNELQYTWRNLH